MSCSSMEEDSVNVATHLLRAYSGCCTRYSGNKDKKGIGWSLKSLLSTCGERSVHLLFRGAMCCYDRGSGCCCESTWKGAPNSLRGSGRLLGRGG